MAMRYRWNSRHAGSGFVCVAVVVNSYRALLDVPLTEDYSSTKRGAQDSHLDFHTASDGSDVSSQFYASLCRLTMGQPAGRH